MGAVGVGMEGLRLWVMEARSLSKVEQRRIQGVRQEETEVESEDWFMISGGKAVSGDPCGC